MWARDATCSATNARHWSAVCGTRLVKGGAGWAIHSCIAGLTVLGAGIVRAGTARPGLRLGRFGRLSSDSLSLASEVASELMAESPMTNPQKMALRMVEQPQGYSGFWDRDSRYEQT